MNGYILESKSIIESDIWKKPPLYFKVWHYLLLKAQFKRNGNLERGQLFTSIPEIAEACSYFVGYRKVTPTKKEIWSILEFLRNPHEGNDEGDGKGTMVETMKVTHGIVVTICNYNKYQDPINYEGNNESHDENRTKELRSGREGNNIKNEIRIKNKNNIDTCQEVVDMYHEECPSLPKCRSISDTRKKHILARLKDHSMDELRLAFQKAEASDFCTGRRGNWKCTFEWMMKSEDNLLKVLEGNYDNRNSKAEKTLSDMEKMTQGISVDEYGELERMFR